MKSYRLKLTMTLTMTAGMAMTAEPAMDVTQKVIAAVKNNSIKTPVNHFAPPIRGRSTQLIKVEYSVGESVLTNSFAQSAMMDIKAPPGKRLIILKATVLDR